MKNLQERIEINTIKGEYKIISLEHDNEHGYFIAIDYYYESHEAGSVYYDLRDISTKEAEKLFWETVNSAKENENV